MLQRSSTKRILPNIWIAPGGHQEFTEGLIAATRREIKEETGLDVKDIKLKVVGIAYLKDIEQEFAFRILTAKHAGGALLQNPEDGRLAWLSVEELTNLDNLLAELRPLVPLILGNDKDKQEVLSVRVVYDSPNVMSEFEIENPN